MTQPDEPDAGSEKPTEIISSRRRPPPLADEETTRVVARGRAASAVPARTSGRWGATVARPGQCADRIAANLLPHGICGHRDSGTPDPGGRREPPGSRCERRAPRVAAATSISCRRMRRRRWPRPHRRWPRRRPHARPGAVPPSAANFRMSRNHQGPFRTGRGTRPRRHGRGVRARDLRKVER